MTQPIHPVLAKVLKATSGWALRIDGDGYRVQYGCVVHGKFHATRESAMQELEVARARAAIQALLEPDEAQLEAACHDDVWEELEDTLTVDVSRHVYTAMLKPLLGDEGALPRSEEKPRQPVPGVYNEEQHAAGFVAKEVG